MKQIKRIRLYTLLTVVLTTALFSACNDRLTDADAYGNFEADEVMVSAEGSGRLLQFNLWEGEVVEANHEVGIIDTTMLNLNRRELKASLQAVAARTMQLYKTIDVHKSRLEVLQKEVTRVTKMYEEDAATPRSYDEATGKLDVAQRELQMVQSQEASIKAEEAMVRSKMALLDEQLKRCRVVSPIGGTVLQKYVEAGEMVAVGKPLFKVAEIKNLILRAYVSGGQLHALKIGDKVTVRYDGKNGAMTETSGTISWVASSAEFTPKIIQTKEERVDLVYAIKIIVPNEKGELKIGMPGEVVFLK